MDKLTGKLAGMMYCDGKTFCTAREHAEAIAPAVRELVEETHRTIDFLNTHIAWLACVPHSAGVSSSVLHRINQMEKAIAKLESDES